MKQMDREGMPRLQAFLHYDITKDTPEDSPRME